MKFVFLSLKKNILPVVFVIIAICLILFSKSNLEAAKSGLSLWANNVVPSLFPFFVITELLSSTNLIYYLGKIFNKIMRPLFHVPGEGSFPFIMGLISGYPVGGKIVSDMRIKKLCTKDEGERLLAFTNNSGPLFIISSVGISLFGDTNTGLLLLCTHILACITVGILLAKFSLSKSKNVKNASTFSTPITKQNEIHLKDLGSLLGKSIQNATSTILMIGGFVVIFSIIISILEKTYILSFFSSFISPFLQFIGFDKLFATPILSGIVELTNGVSMVAKIGIKNISQNVILASFLLGFGGISVLLQVFSIVAKTDLSMKKYVIGKLLQGLFAAFYTFLALKFLPFLSLDISPVCAPIVDTVIYPINFFGMNSYLFFFIILLCIIFFVFSRPDRKKHIKHMKGNRKEYSHHSEKVS